MQAICCNWLSIQVPLPCNYNLNQLDIIMEGKQIKEGDKAKVSPVLTGEKEWIEGEVIDIENNPFKGIVIAIKDNLGRIFFGESKYFLLI